MDTRKVPGEIGNIPEFQEVTGTPPVSIWALLGLSGKEGEGAKEGARPPKPNPNWGGGPTPFPSLPLPLPSSPTPTRKGGNLLLLGVGLTTKKDTSVTFWAERFFSVIHMTLL